jgi:hypothetical protein
VSGLQIAQEGGGLVVYPGLAIDGYGRELLLAGKTSLQAATFDDLGTDSLDVWIVYDRRDAGDPPAGYGSCIPAATGDAYRSDEVPQILLERPVSNIVDARNPPGVSADVLNAPVPLLSDDPKDTWRIYLGRITRIAPGQYSIDGTQRTYIGIVAETVDHPANAARVEIGKQSSANVSRVVGDTTYVYQQGEDPNNLLSRRFAIFVPEDLQEQGPQTVTLAPRLEILQDGTIRFRGETILNGNLRIAGGALQFINPADFSGDNAPQAPSIYRFTQDGKDQLRVDLGSANTADKQFVIGFSADDGSFTPCIKLELLDTNNTGKLAPLVTIFGNLMVQGQLVGQYVPRALSDEAKAAILGSFQAGMGAGGGNP